MGWGGGVGWGGNDSLAQNEWDGLDVLVFLLDGGRAIQNVDWSLN